MKVQELKSKDINFLDAYQKDKEPSRFLPYLKYALPPCILSLVLLLVFAFVMTQNYFIGKDIDNLKAEAQTLSEQVETDPNVKRYQEWQTAQSEAAYYKDLYQDIESYPKLQQGTFNAIANSAYGGIQVVSLNYARESQIITLQIETTTADGAEVFVRRLIDQDIFADVTYSGYQQIEKNATSSTSNEQSISDSDEDKILAYLSQQLVANKAEKAASYTVYSASILCTLK